MSVEESLLSVELTNGMKSWIKGQALPMGSPRYVNGIVPTEQPKMDAILSMREASRLIGMSVDFWKLILRPMD